MYSVEKKNNRLKSSVHVHVGSAISDKFFMVYFVKTQPGSNDKGVAVLMQRSVSGLRLVSNVAMLLP